MQLSTGTPSSRAGTAETAFPSSALLGCTCTPVPPSSVHSIIHLPLLHPPLIHPRFVHPFSHPPIRPFIHLTILTHPSVSCPCIFPSHVYRPGPAAGGQRNPESHGLSSEGARAVQAEGHCGCLPPVCFQDGLEQTERGKGSITMYGSHGEGQAKVGRERERTVPLTADGRGQGKSAPCAAPGASAAWGPGDLTAWGETAPAHCRRRSPGAACT